MLVRKIFEKIFKLRGAKFLNYHFLITLLLIIIFGIQAVLLGFFIFKTKELKAEIDSVKRLQNQNYTIIKNLLNQQRTTLWGIRGDVMRLQK